MNTCPVYRRSGGHSYSATVPGPIGSVLSPANDPERHHSLPYACTLCGSCTDVCPVKIPLHHQLLAWRGELAERKLIPWTKRISMKLLSNILVRPWLFRSAGFMARTSLRWLPKALTHNYLNTWARQRDLPRPQQKVSASSIANANKTEGQGVSRGYPNRSRRCQAVESASYRFSQRTGQRVLAENSSLRKPRASAQWYSL